MLILIILVTILVSTHIMKKVDTQKYRISFIRSYGEVMNGYKMYAIQNGELVGDDFEDKESLVKKISKNLNVKTYCDEDDNYTKSYCLTNKETYKTFDGKFVPMDQELDELGQFVLTDGSLVMLHKHPQGLVIYVDINGIQSKPNILGKDLFAFFISNNSGKFIVMGDSESPYVNHSSYCNPHKAHNLNGFSCAFAVVVNKNYFDGIKMK